uniref:Uncharacterized protein n=1 Tax=Anguilla anguilla TaxID=7936 RepID=A0A0E9QQK9_ANGAN
MVSSFFFFR